MECGVLLIRPHCGDIEREGIKNILLSNNLVYLRTCDIARDDAEKRIREEYAEHVGKSFYEPLIQSMITGRQIHAVMLGRGSKCTDPRPVWQIVREVCGATDPREADPETIRGQYGNKDGVIRENCVHSPDSAEANEAMKERWFK